MPATNYKQKAAQAIFNWREREGPERSRYIPPAKRSPWRKYRDRINQQGEQRA